MDLYEGIGAYGAVLYNEFEFWEIVIYFFQNYSYWENLQLSHK